MPIGRTVASKIPLFGSWEDMHVDVWGQRTGKMPYKIIGDYDKRVASVSTTRGQRTVSEQLHRERILDVATYPRYRRAAQS